MTSFTKKEIKRSFMTLLNEKTIDKIKVKDVTDHCGISRNTFYYHYHDVYEVLEDMLEEECMSFSNEEVEYENLEEVFEKSISFARENKNMVMNIYRSSNKHNIEMFILRISEEVISKFIKQKAKGYAISERDVELLAIFYKYGLIGIFNEWVNRGMEEKYDAIISRMAQLLEGNIEITIQRANDLSPEKSNPEHSG